MAINNNIENYPFRVVLISNLVSFIIYILGFIIIFRMGVIFSIIYLIYILFFEFRLIRYHCINCYYYGKFCGFGKGRISSLFFKKGDISKFCKKEMSWKDMIPDMLITLIPFITGIVLLLLKFEIILLAEIIVLILLTTMGNGYIRGSLTCKYCKQRELGCPADELFNKKPNHQ